MMTDMKEKLELAKGVQFDKEKHEYFLNGNQLSGVTKKIARRLGIKMPEEFVGEAQADGLHVHGAVETWLNGGGFWSMHPGAQWVKNTLENEWHSPTEQCYGELLVSDLKQYASSVDIIGKYADGTLALYDIKRTFKRPYVTWQLSIYKYFIEKYTPYRVHALTCLAVRDKAAYPIFPYPPSNVEELLYRGK